MNRFIAMAVIAGFSCTAATCDTKPVKAIDIKCDAICFQACEPLTAWDGDRDAARLTALMDAHDSEHAACENGPHTACVACIQRARNAGVIQ